MEAPPSHVPDGYDILQRLGAGQTAVVWLARAVRGGQRVALKLPKPEALAQPVLRRMFENEVQITLKLQHANVVRAFDGRPTGEGAFLALEFCEGGTLDLLLLEKGKLPLDQAVALVRDVALGLEHAHERSVLHRDVKPANVFLSDTGAAKLGDFGTGTFSAEMAEERVGTAFYMAPELFAGEAASVRSDVYSLGVLAYEVLSGKRPFLGDSYDALMVAHMTALPRDLRQHRPDIAKHVSAVVMRAMSRDATKRYQNVHAFLQAYRAALGEASAGSATTPVPLATGRAARGKAATPAPSDDTTAPGDVGPEGSPAAGDAPKRRGLFGSWWRRDR
ncbi:MAG: serine/threonine protein kinase [Trueperaceae bacterium]|nr:MAG: serine/threonine protein kinase [Trueperaceae bacterium]